MSSQLDSQHADACNEVVRLHFVACLSAAQADRL